MEAEERIECCEYHLKRMEEFYGKDYKAFVCESQAFLVATRSIMDILLYDFAEKFQLGMEENERLDEKKFKKKARKSNNARALEFIEWWCNKMSEVQKGIFGPLFNKRNIAVHRRSVRPEIHVVKVSETITARESITVIKKDEKGNVTEIFQSPEEPSRTPEPKPAEIDWYYEEYPNENIIEVCGKLLEIVRGIVEEAKSKFT